MTARQHGDTCPRGDGAFEDEIRQPAAGVARDDHVGRAESRRPRSPKRRMRFVRTTAARPEPAPRAASRSKAAASCRRRAPSDEESSSSSMSCASRPCPPPRSTTRPPRKSRRTRRAISHASYSSLRGRHPAWQTARATRWNSVSPGKRSTSRSVSRPRDDGENTRTLSLVIWTSSKPQYVRMKQGRLLVGSRRSCRTVTKFAGRAFAMVAYAPDAPTSRGHRDRLHFELWHRTARPGRCALGRPLRHPSHHGVRHVLVPLALRRDARRFRSDRLHRAAEASPGGRRRPPGARVCAPSARRLGAVPRRGRKRRGRRGARYADGRHGQHHRVSAGADHVTGRPARPRCSSATPSRTRPRVCARSSTACAGPNVTFNQREASSLAAIAYASGLIRDGRVAAMISGGADRLEETFFKVQERFGPFARDEVSRPFDRHRGGFVLGEAGVPAAVRGGRRRRSARRPGVRRARRHRHDRLARRAERLAPRSVGHRAGDADGARRCGRGSGGDRRGLRGGERIETAGCSRGRGDSRRCSGRATCRSSR